MTGNRTCDPRSFGSLCIKGSDESLPIVDSSFFWHPVIQAIVDQIYNPNRVFRRVPCIDKTVLKWGSTNSCQKTYPFTPFEVAHTTALAIRTRVCRFLVTSRARNRKKKRKKEKRRHEVWRPNATWRLNNVIPPCSLSLEIVPWRAYFLGRKKLGTKED